MKKIVLFAPALIAGSLAFAAACDGGTPADMDGSGGDGSGGTSGSGGSTNPSGGSTSSGGASSGGSNTGGLGGLGGLGGSGVDCSMPSDAEVGLGGMGGGGGFTELCEARCGLAVACGASACDEEACVTDCADTFPTEYYANCLPEYEALKVCEVETLTGEDFACEGGTVFALPSGVAKCETEWDDFDACLYP